MQRFFMLLEISLTLILAATANIIIGYCVESMRQHFILNALLKCFSVITIYCKIKEANFVRKMHAAINPSVQGWSKGMQERFLDTIFNKSPRSAWPQQNGPRSPRSAQERPVPARAGPDQKGGPSKRTPFKIEKNSKKSPTTRTGFKYYRFDNKESRVPIMHLAAQGKYFLCDCYLCSVKKQKIYCKIQKCERCSITYKL